MVDMMLVVPTQNVSRSKNTVDSQEINKSQSKKHILKKDLLKSDTSEIQINNRSKVIGCDEIKEIAENKGNVPVFQEIQTDQVEDMQVDEIEENAHVIEHMQVEEIEDEEEIEEEEEMQIDEVEERIQVNIIVTL